MRFKWFEHLATAVPSVSSYNYHTEQPLSTAPLAVIYSFLKWTHLIINCQSWFHDLPNFSERYKKYKRLARHHFNFTIETNIKLFLLKSQEQLPRHTASRERSQSRCFTYFKEMKFLLCSYTRHIQVLPPFEPFWKPRWNSKWASISHFL